ncbi:hypothetical protein SARU107417_14860 [Salinibacter ruber]
MRGGHSLLPRLCNRGDQRGPIIRLRGSLGGGVFGAEKLLHRVTLCPPSDDRPGLLGAGAILLEHRLHARRRDLLGEALKRFGEQGIRWEILLRERDGRLQQRRHRALTQSGLSGPLGHGAHLLDIGSGGSSLVEDGLHVGRLPECALEGRTAPDQGDQENEAEPGAEAAERLYEAVEANHGARELCIRRLCHRMHRRRCLRRREG